MFAQKQTFHCNFPLLEALLYIPFKVHVRARLASILASPKQGFPYGVILPVYIEFIEPYTLI